MPSPPNHLEPWANPPNIFAGAPMQAFMAQMRAAGNWSPQGQQQPAPASPSVPQSPLAAYAGMPAPTATSGGGGQPRSVRTNNPGAIEFGPFAQRAGATGSDGRFAIFPDMAAGYGAMDRLLGTYGQHGQNTVATIIGGLPNDPSRPGWAPRRVDNNSTDTYIAAVARSVGVDPNAPIPAHLMPRVAEAMAAYEAGRPVPRY